MTNIHAVSIKLLSMSFFLFIALYFSAGNAFAWMEQPSQGTAALPGETQLTSGTFNIYLSKKTVKEDKDSATYRYTARLMDSAQAALSDATISFEVFGRNLNDGFMNNAVEKKPGIYEVEITLSKQSSWDITILGKHEPYPFRMSFKESFTGGTTGNTDSTKGVPVFPENEVEEKSPAKNSIVNEKDKYSLSMNLLYLGLGILALGSLAQHLRAKTK